MFGGKLLIQPEKSSLEKQLNAFFSDKKDKVKQEHINVNFLQTILMALADEGHVEKAIKTAFKFHVANSLSTYLFSYLMTQNCREMP